MQRLRSHSAKSSQRFDADLAARPEIVALTKGDLPDVKEAFPALKRRFLRRKIPLFLVSSAAHQGLLPLLHALFLEVERARKAEGVRAKALETVIEE